mgnify:FL=1
MSDLIAPVTNQPSFWDSNLGGRKIDDPLATQILMVLKDIRTELRVLNTSIQAGLNLQDDLDSARKDPHFTNPSSF